MSKSFFANARRALGAGVVLLLLAGCNMDVLNPKGDIGAQEKTLLLTALGLMLLIVIPVIILTIVFAWKYRSSNTKAVYDPKWSHSTAVEVVVWTIPCIIVAILAVMTWKSSHALDPYKPLEAEAKPIEIDVVSLDWKWLFIYPEYKIATVNEITFPVDVPVNFRITSASVMNSFFIPQLGSQIYSMAGMTTKLHLIAREPGTYAGVSANYSGSGFSGMRFKAIASSREEFEQWVAKVQSSPQEMTPTAYQALVSPSEHEPVAYYSGAAPNMFDGIINQYMASAGMDTGMCTPANLSKIALSE
ncbi:Cytochrome bo(3) ubiquinol oxidase subunit 2 precursor [Pigmentiphaga humi]|uniref:Ubiquinol oxidase subunit 2 n=1 Tax=Pigmentiphaga humi TaxID=2478468 RepID=A0A3P4B1B0_9BURK|nr:ubiquinol oxidase subunit II [Pigmentiphaga humi]VCU69651.1 Cytochrome bo(3) ubiquinol oxidase subunit 2 precursor [Pigmentiphaga humi]